MKLKIFLPAIIVLVLSLNSTAQNKKDYNYFLKLSAGRVLFGTGDVAGFSVNIEGSKNIIKTPKILLAKLLIGAEFSFENGVKNPVVDNPTNEEFINRSFYHISNSILSFKLTYYPFKSFFRGFNISIGPSLGYMFSSFEKRAERVVISPTMTQRMSQLGFDNRVIIGYRITTGYEFRISKRIFAGFRLDFSNYNNGDINSLLSGKIGCAF